MTYIKAINISKAYKTYGNKYNRILEWIFPSLIRHDNKWVLKGINFTIESGDSVGIIGSNGAGKSTLLKIIAGAIAPTDGSVEISGTIGALLELGMGFNPEFTGRENIYFAAQLQGLSKQCIGKLIPSIEQFAGIGSYIDDEVRTYSSGMIVRLAFSVATAMRPDILIVDEALSVGDISFQQKCYSRINKFKSEGSIILFVTHDLGTVYNLCNRAMYISDNRLKAIGDVKLVSKLYQQDLKGITLDFIDNKIEKTHTSFIINSELRSQLDNKIKNNFEENENIILNLSCYNNDFDDPHLGFQIRDAKNNIIYETNTSDMIEKITKNNDEIHACFNLENNLCKGEYTMSFGLANNSEGNGSFEKIIADQSSPIVFNVYRETNKLWSGFSNMRVR